MAKKVRKRKTCYICQELSYTDKHHLRPVEYGGPENGRTVDLCPSCHREVHEDAEARFGGILKPYPNDFDFGNAISVEDRTKKQRLAIVSLYIFNTKRNFQDSGKFKADTARNMMQVSFSTDELGVAHELKRALGFKSLERLVKHLVVEKWMTIRKNLNRS